MVPWKVEVSGHQRPRLQAQFQHQAPTYQPGLPPSRLLKPSTSVSPGETIWGNKQLHAFTGGWNEKKTEALSTQPGARFCPLSPLEAPSIDQNRNNLNLQ